MCCELDECDSRRRQRRRRLCTACSSSSNDAVYPQLQQRYSRQKRHFISRHGGSYKRRQRPECHIRNYSSQWKTTLFILWTAFVSYSQADDASSSSSSTPLNLMATQNYCKHHRITVSSLSILCDTPGAYYSGSNAYRNSPVCVTNDKAKLDITCEFCVASLVLVWCTGCV
jgi:hypothetical protein